MTIDQLIKAAVDVFGVSTEQATLAATYATPFTVSPDLNTISIGAPLHDVRPIDRVLLKVPAQGLSFPHNSFEVDSSPTRLDKYDPASQGNNYDLNLALFQQLMDLQKDVPDDKVNFDLNVLADHRLQRHTDSVSLNPNYFLSPFGGLYFLGSKYSAIFQHFANRSAEHPEGRLDRATLMSFYGVEHDEANGNKLKYNKGWERIPDVWYRRPLDDPYDVKKANDDLVTQAKRHPELVTKYGMGGNVASVNAYRSISISQLTNNTYSQDTILDGYNLSCLAMVVGADTGIVWLSQYYEDITPVLQKLFSKLPPLVRDLNCKGLPGHVDRKFFSDAFSGYNKSLDTGELWGPIPKSP